MPIQSRGLDHHMWEFKPRLHISFHPPKWMNFDFLEQLRTEDSFALKSLLFRSCQITQIQHNQSSCMKKRLALEPPAEWINWKKWSWSNNGLAEEKPTHEQMRLHRGAKTGQERNKWCAVSIPPQPVTQRPALGWIICRLTKLSFVGNLMRSNRQVNTNTFKGTRLCQIKFNVKIDV
jgi:hypothetical protein